MIKSGKKAFRLLLITLSISPTYFSVFRHPPGPGLRQRYRGRVPGPQRVHQHPDLRRSPGVLRDPRPGRCDHGALVRDASLRTLTQEGPGSTSGAFFYCIQPCTITLVAIYDSFIERSIFLFIFNCLEFHFFYFCTKIDVYPIIPR